ncbi:MAG: hypothetical protein WBM07_03510 [Chitinivibrionales bacterium]
MTKPEPSAIVVAVEMGMGHLRAAYPLRHLGLDGVLIYGSKNSTPKSEYKIWRKIRTSYYFFSRAGKIPLIGKFLVHALEWLERIGPFYPLRDRSRPNFAVHYLDYVIKRKGLCRELIARIKNSSLPAIHTYFATAIAADRLLDKGRGNYLLICDSDFNRVWAPKTPRHSAVRYLAPCTQVKRRLMSYGVTEEDIFLTGFPLPKENIGSEIGLEILKSDLLERLSRLDPSGRFFRFHQNSVAHWLNRTVVPLGRECYFTVTFAIGGAGAQTELALSILRSLRRAISQDRVRFIVSVGTNKRIFETMVRQVDSLGLRGKIDNGLEVLYDEGPFAFLDKFNDRLRRTDVLWTKPSELVFYSGLGIPILMAPAIGAHEECNKRWLENIHAGINPPGLAGCCHEWLFDLRESGGLAEAAWDGFLKVRKLGAFKIEHLVRREPLGEGGSPLER